MYIEKEWRGWVLIISIFFYCFQTLDPGWMLKRGKLAEGCSEVWWLGARAHHSLAFRHTHTLTLSEATQRFVEIKVTSMSRHTWGGEVKVKKLGQKRKRCSRGCSALLLFLPAVSLIHWILFLTAVANRNLRSDFFWLMLILLGLFGCLLIC